LGYSDGGGKGTTEENLGDKHVDGDGGNRGRDRAIEADALRQET
jgi:hypothetical protein